MEEGIAGTYAVVQDAVAPDGRRVDVGEERVRDALLLAELGQRLAVVIGDGIEPDPGGDELAVRVAQLAELRPARGSPDRGAEEHDHGPRAGTILVDTDEAACRVREGEVRQRVADLGTRGMAVGQPESAGVAEGRGGVEAEFVAFDDHRGSVADAGASVRPGGRRRPGLRYTAAPGSACAFLAPRTPLT